MLCFALYKALLDKPWVLILYGSSVLVAHVWTETGNLIYHLSSTELSNLKFISKKHLMQRFLSYHLISVPIAKTMMRVEDGSFETDNVIRLKHMFLQQQHSHICRFPSHVRVVF